jgi:deoxyribodipyrimidine photo-lyase
MDRHIHEPHLMTDEQQVRAGCRICVEYPEPIVDHKQAREDHLVLGKAEAMK